MVKPIRASDWLAHDTWPLLVALAAVTVPTIAKLSGQTWSSESGSQGPLILCTGLWLLWRQLPELREQAVAGSATITGLLLSAALLLFVIGEVTDLVTFQAAGTYGVGVAMFYSSFGGRLLQRNWFPFLYLAFTIPPPSWWIDSATGPLKRFVSAAASDLLHLVGMPVTHDGVTIYVAQYQLLVEDACSGMNSLFGLIAISLFYVYLIRGASWKRSLFTAFLAIPVAIGANILRIIVLILLTYFFGDEIAQGFLHFAAGIFLFSAALLLIFSIDGLVQFGLNKYRGVT